MLRKNKIITEKKNICSYVAHSEATLENVCAREHEKDVMYHPKLRLWALTFYNI